MKLKFKHAREGHEMHSLFESTMHFENISEKIPNINIIDSNILNSSSKSYFRFLKPERCVSLACGLNTWNLITVDSILYASFY